MENPEPVNSVSNLIGKLSKRLSLRESFFLAVLLVLILAGLFLGVATADNSLRLIAFAIIVLLGIVIVVWGGRSLSQRNEFSSQVSNEDSTPNPSQTSPKPTGNGQSLSNGSDLPTSLPVTERGDLLLKYVDCLGRLTDGQFQDLAIILFSDSARPDNLTRVQLAASLNREPELLREAISIAKRRFPSIAKCLEGG